VSAAVLESPTGSLRDRTVLRHGFRPCEGLLAVDEPALVLELPGTRRSAPHRRVPRACQRIDLRDAPDVLAPRLEIVFDQPSDFGGPALRSAGLRRAAVSRKLAALMHRILADGAKNTGSERQPSRHERHEPERTEVTRNPAAGGRMVPQAPG
jgi:hypothetical protein